MWMVLLISNLKVNPSTFYTVKVLYVNCYRGFDCIIQNLYSIVLGILDKS